MKNSRRRFIRNSTLTGLAVAAYPFSAKSYSRIIGSNERVNLAVAGLFSRGRAHVSAAGSLKQKANVMALCDVDRRVFEDIRKSYADHLDQDLKTYQDVRLLLENNDIDALTIATPDHWHAPMAIMAMQAGKHVYLEKPACHNPREGEWLIEVQKSTGMKLQIGNQQRSGPTTMEVIDDIKNGIIGKASYAKAWYANTRGSIGKGAPAPVPEWLNWELWQGPAPRREYKDNIVHYNWHWFWDWGTGEINNNGFHELDVCRWALGVDIPRQVTSSGGRYRYDDDWEFYDTQIAGFQYDDDKMITWEGLSCDGYPMYGRSRGTIVHGSEGTVILDRDGYQVFDGEGKMIKELKANDPNASSSQDLLGISGLDNLHMNNFLMAIQQDEKLRSPIEEANISNLMCHLGNMSQKLGRALEVDVQTGQPKDHEAMNMWSRSYESGWRPTI